MQVVDQAVYDALAGGASLLQDLVQNTPPTVTFIDVAQAASIFGTADHLPRLTALARKRRRAWVEDAISDMLPSRHLPHSLSDPLVKSWPLEFSCRFDAKEYGELHIGPGCTDNQAAWHYALEGAWRGLSPTPEQENFRPLGDPKIRCLTFPETFSAIGGVQTLFLRPWPTQADLSLVWLEQHADIVAHSPQTRFVLIASAAQAAVLLKALPNWKRETTSHVVPLRFQADTTYIPPWRERAGLILARWAGLGAAKENPERVDTEIAQLIDIPDPFDILPSPHNRLAIDSSGPRAIDFSCRVGADTGLAGGWSKMEQAGLWSLGTASGFAFELFGHTDDIALQFDVSVSPRKGAGLGISVIANNVPVDQVCLKEGPAQFQVIIPRDVYWNTSKLNVELRYDSVVSPRDAVGLADIRPISIFMRRIRISPSFQGQTTPSWRQVSNQVILIGQKIRDSIVLLPPSANTGDAPSALVLTYANQKAAYHALCFAQLQSGQFKHASPSVSGQTAIVHVPSNTQALHICPPDEVSCATVYLMPLSSVSVPIATDGSVLLKHAEESGTLDYRIRPSGSEAADIVKLRGIHQIEKHGVWTRQKDMHLTIPEFGEQLDVTTLTLTIRGAPAVGGEEQTVTLSRGSDCVHCKVAPGRSTTLTLDVRAGDLRKVVLQAERLTPAPAPDVRKLGVFIEEIGFRMVARHTMSGE